MTRTLVITLLLLLVSGCASEIPLAVRRAPAHAVAFETAHQHPQAHVGQRVRWGGTIVRVDNRADGTVMEVLYRGLDSSGRPIDDQGSAGRFLVHSPRFLDPLVFRKDRDVTVTGTLAPAETRPIDGYSYRYAVVNADTIYLWPPRPVLVPAPYWNDPWYPWGCPWWGPGYPFCW